MHLFAIVDLQQLILWKKQEEQRLEQRVLLVMMPLLAGD